jgi:hypothetical protein
MAENDKLFSIQWCAPKDRTWHCFLLFAPNEELARVFAVEVLGDNGLVYSVYELRVKRAAAGG